MIASMIRAEKSASVYLYLALGNLDWRIQALALIEAGVTWQPDLQNESVTAGPTVLISSPQLAEHNRPTSDLKKAGVDRSRPSYLAHSNRVGTSLLTSKAAHDQYTTTSEKYHLFQNRVFSQNT